MQFTLLWIMAGQYHGNPVLLHLVDQREALAARWFIHIGEGFVQQQQPGCQYPGAYHGNPLFLAAGELAAVAPAQVSQCSGFQCFSDHALDFTAINTTPAQAISNVVENRTIKQMGLLVE